MSYSVAVILGPENDSPEVQEEQYNRIKEVTTKCAELNYTIRIGGMGGAENAVLEAYKDKPELVEIHRPWEGFGIKVGEKKPDGVKEIILQGKVLEEATAITTKARGSDKSIEKPTTKKLYARAASQILGEDLENKASLVIFDTTGPSINDANQAIKPALSIAMQEGIEILNIRNNKEFEYIISDLTNEVKQEKFWQEADNITAQANSYGEQILEEAFPSGKGRGFYMHENPSENFKPVERNTYLYQMLCETMGAKMKLDKEGLIATEINGDQFDINFYSDEDKVIGGYWDGDGTVLAGELTKNTFVMTTDAKKNNRWFEKESPIMEQYKT